MFKPEALEMPELQSFLKDFVAEESRADGDDEEVNFDGLTSRDLVDYLKDVYDYDEDELVKLYEDYLNGDGEFRLPDDFKPITTEQETKMAMDVDGDGNIDMTAIDKDSNGKPEEVEVKDGKGKIKANAVKKAITDDDYKAETPEEVEIRKELGVGGKFKPETPEEHAIADIDSTGTVEDKSSDDSSWNDIIGALTERRY
mgnify:FL=1